MAYDAKATDYTLEIKGKKHETMHPLRTLDEAVKVAETLIDINEFFAGEEYAVIIVHDGRQIGAVGF
jgi:hypothetical protein